MERMNQLNQKSGKLVGRDKLSDSAQGGGLRIWRVGASGDPPCNYKLLAIRSLLISFLFFWIALVLETILELHNT